MQMRAQVDVAPRPNSSSASAIEKLEGYRSLQTLHACALAARTRLTDPCAAGLDPSFLSI